MSETPSIRCPQCGLVSHNPNDVKYRYCGNCNQFHDMMSIPDRMMEMARQVIDQRRTDGEFILSSESANGSTEVWDRGGVSWHKAPLPRRWHRCRVQTRGWFNYFELVERCACGAIRMNSRMWLDRNQRRKG